jgi:hypothetical protein
MNEMVLGAIITLSIIILWFIWARFYWRYSTTNISNKVLSKYGKDGEIESISIGKTEVNATIVQQGKQPIQVTYKIDDAKNEPIIPDPNTIYL